MTADPKKFKAVKQIGLGDDLWSVAWAPDSNLLFAGGGVGKIYQVDLTAAKPEPMNWQGHASFVSGLVLTGKHLISAGSDHQLIWWDRQTRQQVRVLKPHAKWIRYLALAPEGHLLASVGDDMVCRLWEAATGKPIRELRGHALQTPYQLASKLYMAVFTSDGKHLASADQAGHVLVWEVATGKQVADVHAPHFYTADTNGHSYGGIRAVTFSADGKLLALGGNLAGDTSTITGSTSLVQVYDWQTGKQTHEFKTGGNFFYERVCFHHEGRWLVGAGGAGSGQKIVFFDLERRAILYEAPSNMLVFDMALNATSDTLVTVGGKGKANIIQWELKG